MCCGHHSGWALRVTPSAGRERSCAPKRGVLLAVVPPAAHRLAELVAELNTMAATVQAGREDFARHESDPAALAGLGFAIRMNNLKVAAARMAPEIVAGALGVCGISGYRNDSPYAVGRHLRDAHGASLMVSNDRILAANAAMLLLHKED